MHMKVVPFRLGGLKSKEYCIRGVKSQERLGSGRVGSGRVGSGTRLKNATRPKLLSFCHSSATILLSTIALSVTNLAPGIGYQSIFEEHHLLPLGMSLVKVIVLEKAIRGSLK